MSTYIGVAGKSRKMKAIYLGVNGVSRNVLKAYIGVKGVAKLVFSKILEPIFSKFLSPPYSATSASQLSAANFMDGKTSLIAGGIIDGYLTDQIKSYTDGDPSFVGTSSYLPVGMQLPNMATCGLNNIAISGGIISNQLSCASVLVNQNLVLKTLNVIPNYGYKASITWGMQGSLFAGGYSNIGGIDLWSDAVWVISDFGLENPLVKLTTPTGFMAGEDLNGSAIIAGGKMNGNKPSDTVYRFDSSGVKTNLAKLAYPRWSLACGKIGNDKVLFTGGRAESSVSGQSDVYDKNGIRSNFGFLPIPLYASTGENFNPNNGLLIITGGSTLDNKPKLDAWRVDEVGFKTIPKMEIARSYSAAISFKDNIMFIGGNSPGLDTSPKTDGYKLTFK